MRSWHLSGVLSLRMIFDALTWPRDRKKACFSWLGEKEIVNQIATWWCHKLRNEDEASALYKTES